MHPPQLQLQLARASSSFDWKAVISSPLSTIIPPPSGTEWVHENWNLFKTLKSENEIQTPHHKPLQHRACLPLSLLSFRPSWCSVSVFLPHRPHISFSNTPSSFPPQGPPRGHSAWNAFLSHFPPQLTSHLSFLVFNLFWEIAPNSILSTKRTHFNVLFTTCKQICGLFYLSIFWLPY